MQMDFQWTDHTPVIFTYWHPFEPNNFRNIQEDCVTIWGPVSAPLNPSSLDPDHLTAQSDVGQWRSQEFIEQGFVSASVSEAYIVMSLI